MKWISVKERYPDTNKNHDPNAFIQVQMSKKYLVTHKNIFDDKDSVDCYTWNMNTGKFMGTFHDSHESVTHWAEMPKPAKP